MTYQEKLKDPRWQKNRLLVLDRDKFTCQHCESTDKTLHVHHLYYTPTKAPWDYPLEAFVSLCEDCHAKEEEKLKSLAFPLLNAFRSRLFDSSGIANLLDALDLPHEPMLSQKTVLLIDMALNSPQFTELIIAKYKEVYESYNGTGSFLKDFPNYEL